MKRKSVITVIAMAALATGSAGTMVAQNAFADSGEDVGTRIIGGVPASEEYGFSASLQYEKNGNPNSHRCGAALIDDRWVLTAAHCVVNGDGTVWDPALLHVNIGSNDNTKGTNVQVDAVEPHPDYNKGRENAADIALLRLAEAPDTEVLPLGGAGEAGSEVREIGWGLTVSGDPGSGTSQLRELDTRILEYEECLFGEWEITKGDLCVGTPGNTAGVCNGDSGSPLLQKVDGQWVTVGVVSRGGGTAGCLNTNEVFTGVDYYKDWIKQVLDGSAAS